MFIFTYINSKHMERDSHAQQMRFHFGTNTESSHNKLYRNENELPISYLSKNGIFREFYIRFLIHFRIGHNLVSSIIFQCISVIQNIQRLVFSN